MRQGAQCAHGREFLAEARLFDVQGLYTARCPVPSPDDALEPVSETLRISFEARDIDGQPCLFISDPKLNYDFLFTFSTFLKEVPDAECVFLLYDVGSR